EIAVASFLDGRLPFLGIARLNEAILAALPAHPEGSLEDVLAADVEARHLASQMILEEHFS
ncbi:MAG: 1-deoxy-D-xylulose-5-phosphate reductoisomerase, partial [Azonexus sp.]|nr:1-deoxy-D-xylulose-5-phosphate reductoisomerase [Azonexus sp.]